MPGLGCLEPRLTRFGRFAQISGPVFQKVSGDAIPFFLPQNKAHCSHHDLFPSLPSSTRIGAQSRLVLKNTVET